MHPALVITLAAAAALPLGLWLRHNLNQLAYRVDEERDLPRPGHRWWVVWTTVLAAAVISAAAALSDDAVSYLPLVPLVVSGPWLAAVDFDVMRILNRILAPTAATTLLAVLGVAAIEHDCSALILPLAAASIAGVSFAGVHFATKGGIGFGDVKLAALIGLALGTLGAGAVWLSLLAGSIAALIWRSASRSEGALAYGPWLLLGAGVGVFIAALAL